MCLTLLLPTSAVALERSGPGDNPRLERRVLNMAHSGGELEAPMNTMYAFKRADRLGADVLELDVQSSRDGRLIVIHDATVNATTNGRGKVANKTIRQLRRLDAAYWFVPGKGTVSGLKPRSYPLRGARNGRQRVRGYVRSDFRIPTLGEVFKAFPDTPINIEIKGTSDDDVASYLRTGKLLARFLNRRPRTDVIVASFKDEVLADFHGRAPHVGLAAGQQALMGYFLTGEALPEGTVALQVPVEYSGIPVVTRDFVQRAQRDGYAVHVWFSGSAPDTSRTYRQMINACVDGLMPARPRMLERILDERGIERPGEPGVDPCA